jgi:hypothetical protein
MAALHIRVTFNSPDIVIGLKQMSCKAMPKFEIDQHTID